MFRKIYAHDKIMPHFLKLVSGFQGECSLSDEDFMSSYSSYSPSYTGSESVSSQDSEENSAEMSCYG